MYNELYKRKKELEEYKVKANNSKIIDIYTLRDILFESIKDGTTFLNEIREGNKRFVSDDQFLKDILEKRKEDYIMSGLFGKEEQIKISLISLINKLAHEESNNNIKGGEEIENTNILSKNKEKALQKGIHIRGLKENKYVNDIVVNELEPIKEEWYDRKKATLDVKKLKQILEISGAKKNDENIKNKDLLEFNTALNYKEIENLLFDIKEIVMKECIKDKRINKAIYSDEVLKINKGFFTRLAFNTDDQYMLTMAHFDKLKYDNISEKFTSNVKKVKRIPRALSTTFPIFLNEEEWSLEEKYKNIESSYKTKYRNIKDKFDEYDKLDTHDEEEINDY